ncbi:hypothetical protein evm_009037 [Chilo suppressalis]|nr:hypothetical protein evm_009037 [Chilo suppressalis]
MHIILYLGFPLTLLEFKTFGPPGMDEGLLNDLLECSVCLERLDTSSRVLPCQHTFCLKCLKVIVESHKELRCPECRILVEAKVEELPPNVLLMRILEGMKNSAPRKPSASTHRKAGHLASLTQGVQATRTDCKQLPPHARAMHDYISMEPGDLSFKKGDTVVLQKKLDPFWYQGECSGRTGMFPITYVQIVVPLPIPTALCKALYDFRMSAPDEEGCLAFDKGAIITVHRRVDENWAEGRLDQRVGIFPIAFVELNQAARQLMNSVPLNRPVPPLPDHARPSHSDHRHHVQATNRYQPTNMSISTPNTGHNNYHHNTTTMSQSQPQPTCVPVARAILTSEPHTKLDLIHLTAVHKAHVGLQSLRIADNYDRRAPKYEYNPKVETTYQNVRTHEHFPVSVANFNSTVSSDSSSSMNTPVGVSSTTTPNTSSNTSTCESAEPSLPSSPDNNTDRNSTVVQQNTNQNGDAEAETNERESSLNTSMGVLSLNESSTATNTSLNVSLPPAESPKLNASNATVSSQNHSETEQGASNNEPRLDAPSSSKNVVVRPSGPDSLLNFGIGLQAALSPSHSKDANYMASRNHREHHNREKRHSLTPSTHLQSGHSTQNRHSAEILATSLLDHVSERERDRPERERERERRRRRSRSNERPLPAAYVALYPYKPQKPDELELRKGAVYTVTERCRDGWYKGCGDREPRCGVFPGNYVAPAPASAPAPTRIKHDKAPCSPSPASVKPSSAQNSAPDAPPRENSPLATNAQPLTYPWSSMSQTQPQQSTPRLDKKDKSKVEKSTISSGVSLMKRLAAMKKCKSPPPAYSMDNPVFEDAPGPSLALHGNQHHPVHVSTASEGPWQSHRKSQSLDVTAARRERPHSQTVKERFRCIVPYPPNSEYELELKVDDIVVVSRKRGDGWYKGTLQRTGRTGLFPASFVQSCPHD